MAEEAEEGPMLKKMEDVNWPAKSEGGKEQVSLSPQENIFGDAGGAGTGGAESAPTGRKKLPRGIVWGITAMIAFFIIALFFSFKIFSKNVAGSVSKNVSRFQSGVSDLKNFNPAEAERKFQAINTDVNLTFGGLISKIKPFFREGRSMVEDFQVLSQLGVDLSREIESLQNNFFNYVLNRQGGELLARIKNIQKILGEINGRTDKASSVAGKFSDVVPSVMEFYLPFKLDLARDQIFLERLLSWLESDSERHLVLMLQNPSEIRPAGGFLGSYADIVIKDASFQKVEVHDINEPDRQMELKVIPPRPLQPQVIGFKAADANWFFDFSYSASKVMEFLEASNFYKTNNIKFDAAIAVSPKVVGDMLSLTGPIALEKERITVDKDNFLVEIQKKVQFGQSSRATYPKQVLKEITRQLFSKVAAIGGADKQKILIFLREWLADKDVMVYSKDPELEKFFDYYGASGKIYGLPANFEGDYLAVVDANVGGGKSDLFIKQSIDLESQINIDGTVNNHLAVSREHQGQRGGYWWYKETNEDYLQIFAPDGSQIINFKGAAKKKIYPRINYSRNGYVPDSLVSGIESGTEEVFNFPAVQSHKESGKKVFSVWSRIGAGEKTELVFDYSRRLPLAPADGVAYKFVFEKQAGTARAYKFQINAPVGFVFKENGLPVYEYRSDDPPGRLIVNLTLEKV